MAVAQAIKFAEIFNNLPETDGIKDQEKVSLFLSMLFVASCGLISDNYWEQFTFFDGSSVFISKITRNGKVYHNCAYVDNANLFSPKE